MNELEVSQIKGSLAELLVQIKLLQFGVEAAPALNDTGNDLIAVHGEIFRAIQVRARTPSDNDDINCGSKAKNWHLLALVVLPKDEAGVANLSLDKTAVYLVPKEDCKTRYRVADGKIAELARFELKQVHVDNLFSSIPY